MTEYVIQIVSALRVTAGNTKTFAHLITPMAPFLFITGDLGDPFHTSYMHFLSWSSCNWERVVFVAGAEEYSTGSPEDVDIQCRLLASRLHNVRFLQNQVDGSIPGVQLVGASLAQPCKVADQTRFLERHLHEDCVLLTYGCLCNSSGPLDPSGCLKWVCGTPCSVCSAKGLVCNAYGHEKPYDSSFYITINIKSSTFYFVSGRDDFPPVTKAAVTTLDVTPRYSESEVCFYCGHAGHSKNTCPLIQCNVCSGFGHSDRICPCVVRNKF